MNAIKKRNNGQPHRIELIENFATIPYLRKNDSFIMKQFITDINDPSKLKILNIMRMSIKAITLSDICTPDGHFFTSNAWNLKESNGLREDYDWPRKPPAFTDAQIKCW